MATVVEPAAETTTDPGARILARQPSGWAGDLIWCGGAPWLAFATCDDPEPDLLAPVTFENPLRREAPLGPGVTPDDWRRAAARTGFAVWLARLDGDRLPEPRRLSHSAHAVEGPTLAARAGDTAPAVFWAERRGAGHALLAAIDGSTVEVVAERRGATLGPRAAAGPDGRLWVAWQQWPDRADQGGRAAPRVVAAERDGRGWSAPAPISPEGQPAWAPSLAAGPDGTLWCAWDGWDGAAYQIYAACAPQGHSWSAPVQVSQPARGNYRKHLHLAPDVAAAGGRAWVVWSRSAGWGEVNHRFNHTRSLHAAVLTLGDGAAEGAIDIQPAPGEPVLGEQGLLPVQSIPFLHSSEEEYINPQAPRVRLAGAAAGIEHAGSSGPTVRAGEAAQTDQADRPVVFYRQFRSAEFKDFGWTVCAVAHTGNGWAAPQRLSTETGMPDTPYGVVPDSPDDPDSPNRSDAAGSAPSRWLLAYHSADYPLAPNYHPSKPQARHRLVVERATAAPAPDVRAGLYHLPPFEVPVASRDDRIARSTAVPAAAVTRRDDREPAVREIEVGGQRYALLFGDLHRHSIYSKCMSANDGDPLDHWRWVADVDRLDFYAITEHLEYMSYVEWRRVEDLAESLAAGGVLALCGWELAIPPGHTNFFYADQRIGHDLRVACLTSATLADVWPKLDAWIPEGKVVAIRHHQGHRGDDLSRTYAARYEPLAEIIQSRGEYPDWLALLRRQGFRVGVAGATDHSRAAPIVQGLTGLWLPVGQHSRDDVLDGFRARRTFATNGPRIAVFLSAEDTGPEPPVGMGQDGRVGGAPRLVVQAAGTRTIETVAFYRDERLLHVETVGAPAATVRYVDGDAPPGEHAYWVRVVQERERNGARPHQGVAYSSPVWLTV